MRRTWQKGLAALLTLAMVFTMLPVGALAADSGTPAGNQTERTLGDHSGGGTAFFDQTTTERDETYSVGDDSTLREPSAMEQVQTLIDALPDAGDIGLWNRTDVEAQLSAIDEARLSLTDDEQDALDITRYMAAVDALYALDSIQGSNEIAPLSGEHDMSTGPLNITAGGDYTVTGESSTNTITVNVTSGDPVNITLRDVSVTSGGTAFDIQKGNVTLNLTGVNSFESGSEYAGIHVLEGASLTIQGEGTLYATSSKYGAGIGGDHNSNAGNITINSGTIVARSNNDGAGIGGGHANDSKSKQYGRFQSITIKGGKVTAESAGNGAGIGCGCWAKAMGSITISGGEIHAKSGAPNNQAYAIGYAHRASDFTSTINITGGVIFTEGNHDRGIGAKTVNKNNAIIVDRNNNVNFLGNPTITSDVTIPSGVTLTVPSGRTLTVAEGVILTIEEGARLDNQGVVTGEGVVLVNGEVSGEVDIAVRAVLSVPSFPEESEDYSVEPMAVTVSNNGTRAITITDVEVQGTDFTFVQSGESSISASTTGTIGTIQPQPGLQPGTYRAVVSVTINGAVQLSKEVSFTVTISTIPYIDEHGEEQSHDTAYLLTEHDITLEAGWYLVRGDITIQDRIIVNGDVTLVLEDGCELVAEQGINVEYPSKLTITCQSGRTGSLIAAHNVLDYGGAAIGAGRSETAGTITINGGNITAKVTEPKNSPGGSCIGNGGWNGGRGTVIINDGYLKLYSGGGQGEGAFGDGYNVINGGVIEYTYESSKANANSLHAAAASNCVIIDQNKGEVIGDAHVTHDVSLSRMLTLTVPEGGSLIVDANATLENKGTIRNNGTIVEHGIIKNNGIIIGPGPITDYLLEITDLEFSTATLDYTQAPVPISIKNRGVCAADISEVTVSGEDFLLSGSGTVVKAGDTMETWMVQPKPNLTAGIYSADILVAYNGGRTATAKIVFMVFDFDGGDGTEGNPYVISTLTQLESLRDYINQKNDGENQCFALGADIDLSDRYGEDIGGEKVSWMPIGAARSGNNAFCGNFDGRGHLISGLFIDDSDSKVAGLFGLFGRLSGGTVRDLRVSGIVRSEIAASTGGIAAENEGGTIEDCSFTGIVHNADSNNDGGRSGGIVGHNGEEGSIVRCTNAGAVSGPASGGIAGVNQDGYILECTNTGTVFASMETDPSFSTKYAMAGGIAADNYGGAIYGCTNAGAIQGDVAGGIVGQCMLDDYTELSRPDLPQGVGQCSNTGDVTGTMCVGGITGQNGASVSNCYNTGTISGDGVAPEWMSEYGVSMAGVGGIVGMNAGEDSLVENCYNTGEVSAKANGGSVVGANGFVIEELGGELMYQGTIQNCYYLDTLIPDSIATPMTADQFASGVVAHELQSAQKGDPADQVWGQKLSGDDADPTPILTTDEDEAVRKVTFMLQDTVYNVQYVNNNGYAAFPESPTKGDLVLAKWAKTNDINGEAFDETMKVTDDLVLYAVGQEGFAWSGDPIAQEKVNYGAGLTIDLSSYIAYLDETDPEGAFEFEIVDYDRADGKVSIDGATLTVSEDLDAGTYSIAIAARDKSPDLQMMTILAAPRDTYTAITHVAITVLQIPGSGSVSMADYTCGETGVNPVFSSSTNDTETAVITYKSKSADDSAYSSAKPTQAGEYTVQVVFPANTNYTETTVTSDFTVTHDWGSWTITEEPTQTEGGKAERNCAFGDNTAPDTADLPKLADETVWTKGERVDPAPGKDGFQTYLSEYGTVTELLPKLPSTLKGTVKKDDTPVEDATVTLKQGNTTYETTTDAEGNYVFGEVPPGIYEVVIEADGKVTTSMLEITEETGNEQDLTIPDQNVSSVLDGSNAEDTLLAVDGLDDLAVEHADPAGNPVTVTLTVSEEPVSAAAHAKEIQDAAKGRYLDFYEIGLEKITETGGTLKEEPITATKEPLTIILTFDFTGKTEVQVYRYHGSGVDILTEKPNAESEFITLDPANNTIVLTVKNFSTYAIGYYLEGQEHTKHSSDTWHIDEATGQHYKICDVCGAEFDRAAHKGTTWHADAATGQHYKTCDVCGQEFARATHASDTWHVDEATGQHYKTCDDCGAEFGHATHASDTWHIDDTTGQHYKTCDECKEEFARAAHASDTWHVDDATGQHYKTCDVCEAEFAREDHDWTLQSTDETTADKTYICECGATKTERGSERSVSGKVVQKDGTPAAGAHVQLMQGDTVVAETITDENGNYVFPDVEPGTYNLVVEMEDSSTTILTTVGEDTDSETTENVTMPAKGVKSKLEVKGEDTPKVVVGGLTEEAEAQQTDGSTVTLTLTVESKPENQATHGEDIRKETGENTELTFLDIQVAKSENGGTEETMAETKTVLEIVIPYEVPDEGNIVVYRSADGTVETLTTTPNADGEYIEVRDNAIVLHVKHSGTYAIGCRQAVEEPSYTITVQAGSYGTVTASTTSAKQGETVTLTVTPHAGFRLYTLGVVGPDGELVSWTYVGNGKYTFTMPAGDVTVNATFAVIQYSEPEPTPTPTPTPSTTPVIPSTPATPSNPAPATYSITVPAATTGGSVTADPERAAEGASVKLTVKAEDGYHLDALTVLDQDGKAVALQDNQDGTYTFTMHKGAASVQATFVKCSTLSFPDLDPTAWYHEHTDYVISHGLMNGNEKGLFEPDGTVTRAQMVTLLWNLKGKPVVNFYMTYSDVSEEVWYAEAIRWATSEGIVSGCGDGSFGPEDTITREQMATMIYQYEKKYGDGGFTGTWMFRMPFNDLDQISEWAYEGVAWCYMRDVITGKDNELMDPKGHATRAEMAAILTQYLKKDAEDEEEPA